MAANVEAFVFVAEFEMMPMSFLMKLNSKVKLSYVFCPPTFSQ
jgi:hypothetical protein